MQESRFAKWVAGPRPTQTISFRKPRLGERIAGKEIEEQVRNFLTAGLVRVGAVGAKIRLVPDEAIDLAPLLAFRPKVRSPEKQGSLGVGQFRVAFELPL